jgi:hypothetical protein
MWIRWIRIRIRNTGTKQEEKSLLIRLFQILPFYLFPIVHKSPPSDSVNKILKGLSHEIDFKTFDKNLQNLA